MLFISTSRGKNKSTYAIGDQSQWTTDWTRDPQLPSPSGALESSVWLTLAWLSNNFSRNATVSLPNSKRLPEPSQR
jgi:hypothetical protein